MAYWIVGAPHKPIAAEVLDDSFERPRLRNRRAVAPDIPEPIQGSDPLDGMKRVEAPSSVRQDQFNLWIFFAVVPDLLLVSKVGHRTVTHHVQRNGPALLVRNTHMLLAQEFRHMRLPGGCTG